MSVLNYRSDAGTAITAEIITHPDYCEAPENLKQINQLYIFATPRSTLKVFISFDGGDWELLGQVNDHPQFFDVGYVKCYYFQLKLTEASSNAPFEWQGYTKIFDVIGEIRK